jgi:hypothetical protein
MKRDSNGRFARADKEPEVFKAEVRDIRHPDLVYGVFKIIRVVGKGMIYKDYDTGMYCYHNSMPGSADHFDFATPAERERFENVKREVDDPDYQPQLHPEVCAACTHTFDPKQPELDPKAQKDARLAKQCLEYWYPRARGEERPYKCALCDEYRLGSIDGCFSLCPLQDRPNDAKRYQCCCKEFHIWENNRTTENALAVVRRLEAIAGIAPADSPIQPEPKHKAGDYAGPVKGIVYLDGLALEMLALVLTLRRQP